MHFQEVAIGCAKLFGIKWLRWIEERVVKWGSEEIGELHQKNREAYGHLLANPSAIISEEYCREIIL